MKISEMLENEGYTTPENEIGEIIGSPADEILLGDPITPCPGHDLTIWPWESADGEFVGFLRDDTAGFSSVCLDHSRDDQLRLASWNADFDIRILPLTAGQLRLALEDTAANQWGI